MWILEHPDVMYYVLFSQLNHNREGEGGLYHFITKKADLFIIRFINKLQNFSGRDCV